MLYTLQEAEVQPMQDVQQGLEVAVGSGAPVVWAQASTPSRESQILAQVEGAVDLSHQQTARVERAAAASS